MQPIKSIVNIFKLLIFNVSGALHLVFLPAHHCYKYCAALPLNNITQPGGYTYYTGIYNRIINVLKGTVSKVKNFSNSFSVLLFVFSVALCVTNN